MTTANTELAGLEDLDLALANLDLDAVDENGIEAEANEETLVEDVLETVTDEVIEEIVEEGTAEVSAADTALADDMLRDLDIGLEVIETYEATEGEAIDPAGAKTAEVGAHVGKPAAAAKPKKPAGEKGTRTPRDIKTVPAEFFALTEPADGTDLEAVKAVTLALKPEQKKIAEKFENLFTALSASKAPSTYVMIAFNLLDEKKEVTSADIVAAYKANELKEGTARSQSGQIMNLFATVKIATRVGQVLKLNADSKIAERIRALPKSA